MIRRPHTIIYLHWKSVKKRLVSKPSEKVVLRLFRETETLRENKSEFKSDK